ncbi:MAG TPA: CarD family transcriptional regulator, partial [Candidatus Monoglobus merdigallinarum]|nr:CarD family transcriptional regulator [Candidatus Monoglobus merdigallinarum]
MFFMFQIGDKVAYPMHGAGVIKCVEVDKILGEEHRYYVLKPCVGELEIKIPV